MDHSKIHNAATNSLTTLHNLLFLSVLETNIRDAIKHLQQNIKLGCLFFQGKKKKDCLRNFEKKRTAQSKAQSITLYLLYPTMCQYHTSYQTVSSLLQELLITHV